MFALSKIFGTQNDRIIKSYQHIVDQINAFEPQVKNLSDQKLQDKTKEFKNYIQEELKKDKKPKDILLELLPESFAVVREASRRVLGMRHFDVQLIGGIVLHEGKIAEMRTGEGKTLVATLPVYLNALLGRGVHVVTVNDYLARRDSQWMGEIYKFLGLTVGCVTNELSDAQRQEAYRCDVTYGQNNEFGFDYLRDNMKYRLEDYVQRDLYFAIVDEVDSILIDEARTPLIISGPTEDSTDKYYKINQVIPRLKIEEDFTVEEKNKSAALTEEGIAKLEKILGIENLYDPDQMEVLHHINQGIRAHHLFHKDVDYMVKDDEVMIIDEFTGRLMQGRRWSDGLHQAIEAKENVTIANENQTLASITFQNYFRMFEKLSGMTGTAETEAEEFHKIYNLDVVVIPTNKPIARLDHHDLIYVNTKAKYEAIVRQIKELHQKGQPVLVGTVSIENSEKLSAYLTRNGVKHNVLNAKHHEREAEIVADAGQPGQVTIATNMAGRGTDIVLGQGVKEKGGLFIIGTERHESRRIDNQLRGRSGRQGDPGASRFYLSLEDDLMRIFANEQMKSLMQRSMGEEDAIESRLVSRSVETAQRRVEGHNFDIRKHLIKYDDVMNKQRQVIYTLRKDVLGRGNIREIIDMDLEEVLESMVLTYSHEKTQSAEWDWEGLSHDLERVFGFTAKSQNGKTQEDLFNDLLDQASNLLQQKESQAPQKEFFEMVQREIKLRTIDAQWKDHLHNMDQLKEAVGFEGYAQKDPLKEYQKRGYEMFSEMVYSIKELTLRRIFHVQINVGQDPKEVFARRSQQALNMQHAQAQDLSQAQASAPNMPGRTQIPNMKKPENVTVRRTDDKVGRNDPCPCGSGKKFKKCHGA
ncbi:MAG: preprotein translocase subunit SecA [Bdellovibrionales bacterium]|nr:preprotein translocase subunit SecA [Bdellovibrionales bacterium]